MRFFSILAAFLTIAFALLFFNRLIIIEELLTGRIEKSGGHSVQVTVNKLNSSELTVSSLTATFPKEFPVQDVKIRNLSLSFPLKDLLKGQIAALTIDVLQVGLGKTKRITENTLSYQSIQKQIEQRQLPPFLPKYFLLKDLILTGPGAGPLTGLSLQIETRLLASGFYGTLQVPDKQLKIETVLNHPKNGIHQLQVDAHRAAKGFFHLNLQHKHGETSGKLTTQLNALNVLSPPLPFSLPEIAGEIEVDVTARDMGETRLDVVLAFNGQNISLPGWDIRSLVGNISLQAENFENITFQQGSHLAINQIQNPSLKIDDLYYQFSGNLQGKQGKFTLLFGHDSQLEINGLSRDTLKLKQAVIVPALSVTHDLHETQLSLHPEFIATIEELQQDKVYISSLSLSPETPIHLISPTALMQNSGVKPGKIIIKLKELHVQDLIIQPAPLSLTIQSLKTNPLASQFQGLLHSNGLSLQWKNTHIPLHNIQLTLSANNNNLKISAGLSHARVPGRIEGNVIHDVRDGTGQAQFATVQPFDLRAEQTNLNQLISGMQLPFSLSSGLTDFTATSQWGQNGLLFLTSTFELREGIANYKKIVANGLTIRQELQLFPQFQTLAPGHIFINELTNGITIENIELTNQLSPSPAGSLPTLHIDSIEGQLLGGRISSNNITFDPAHPEGDFSVQLKGVALEEVTKIIKMKGLSVTGVIDGTIPMQLRNRQIHVADGELRSKAPGGIINYLPPGGSGTLPYLPGYVVQALEEFHYDTLSAKPHYKPDGTLTLAFNIKGTSPRLKTNRPVHLNLNSEQNLLSLLQSLRYSKRLTDDLEKQIQAPHSKN